MWIKHYLAWIKEQTCDAVKGTICTDVILTANIIW
jgi:hypothetical protein